MTGRFCMTEYVSACNYVTGRQTDKIREDGSRARAVGDPPYEEVRDRDEEVEHARVEQHADDELQVMGGRVRLALLLRRLPNMMHDFACVSQYAPSISWCLDRLNQTRTCSVEIDDNRRCPKRREHAPGADGHVHGRPGGGIVGSFDGLPI